MENKKKKNLKLYPKYRQLSMDFLFYYTINVLFLTQVKKIDICDVVLVDTFYALFVILWQIPATILVSKIGRKKGTILGNVFNILYLLQVMNSKNLMSLILAELMSSFAFTLKDISEPSILNISVSSVAQEKSNVFAKIQGKAVSGYYKLSAISMILAGFLYEINGYIPITLSLCIVIIVLILSTRFEEITEQIEEDDTEKNVTLKDAIKFAFQSQRCRCLLIFSGIFYGTITVLATYEISLLEDMKISSKYLGIIFAFLNIVSSIASRQQHYFQETFKNKTLTVLGIALTVSCIIAASVTYLNINIYIILAIVLIMYIVKYFMVGLYNVLLIKYLSNFTNHKIDSQIFALNSFVSCILSVISGVLGSGLLRIMPIQGAMLSFGIIGLFIIISVLFYMKDKVGLDPSKYSKLELKYDKVK